jgi:endonuclease YncB( thermonuclease family)
MTNRLFLSLLLAVCGAVHAAGFAGRVVGVADGDTLTVLDADNRQYVIRLAEVDAPEKAQAFGNRSKQHLSAPCFGKAAVITPRTTDRYRRTVARVDCEGTNASAEQVHAGMAWVFDRYVTDRGLYAVQDEARVAGRGLWADQQQVAPWEWRKTGQSAR